MRCIGPPRDAARQTSERAERFSLIDVRTLAKLCESCSLIISVCPPHAAEDVAQQVLEYAFLGLYVDANAISPERARRIGARMDSVGVAFVDGGIIGGPAWEPAQTWLYLSGEQAQVVESYFAAGPLKTAVIGQGIGKASALKMCYAAYTRGTTALLCAILASAETLGVRDELQRQWSRDWADFAEQVVSRVRHVTAKAWRFSGEMEEISATFDQARLPGDFHAAAADIFRRIAPFKDAPTVPPLEDVLKALVDDDRMDGG